MLLTIYEKLGFIENVLQNFNIANFNVNEAEMLLSIY